MKIYERILPVASETVARMIQEFNSRENTWYNVHNETGYQLALTDLMEIEMQLEYAQATNSEMMNETYAEWKENVALGVSTEEQYLYMRDLMSKMTQINLEDEAYIEKIGKID